MGVGVALPERVLEYETKVAVGSADAEGVSDAVGDTLVEPVLE